tara:strand:+ start:501 stop:728 length:228 start_codon:yes stop_codon:yes gene_type:complete
MIYPLPKTWREVLDHPGIAQIEDERLSSRHRNLDLYVWIFLHKSWRNPVTKEKGGKFLVRTIWELREYWPDIQKA